MADTQLPHALGDQVNQDVWVPDLFQCLLTEFWIHVFVLVTSAMMMNKVQVQSAVSMHRFVCVVKANWDYIRRSVDCLVRAKSFIRP